MYPVNSTPPRLEIKKPATTAALALLSLVLTTLAVTSASAQSQPTSSQPTGTQPQQKIVPQQVYVIDAAGIEDPNEIFTLTSLQGIVNRDAPRLFVRAYFHKFGPEEQVFMDYLSREKGYRFQWVSLGEAIEIFAKQGLIKGLVRYNGARYEQGCIAATIAGLDGLLPVSDPIVARQTPMFNNREWRVEDRFERKNGLWRQFRSQITVDPNGTTIRRQPGMKDHNLDIHSPFAGLESWLSIDIDKTPILEVDVKNLGDVWSLIFDQGAVHTGQNSWVWIEKNTKKEGLLTFDLRKIPNLVGGRRRTLVRFITPTETSALQIKSFRLLDANGRLVKEEPPQRDWFAGLQTKMDLSTRFANPEAASQWAVSELLPKTSTEYAFAAQPGWFNTKGIDFAVAQKAFIFQKMNAKGQPETAPYAMEPLLSAVLKHLKPPGIILGWLGHEWKSTTILTAYGHGMYHSGAANLSFWAKVPTSGPVSLPRNATPGKQLENKYYVTFAVNPGDTPNGFMSFWWNTGNWLDPARGKVPMTWLISPTALKCTPAVVEYFAKTATPKDTFMIPPTGSLYTYPSAVLGNEKVLFPLIDETRRLSAQMGLEGMIIWDPCLIYPFKRWSEPGTNPPIRLFERAISGMFQNLYLNDGTPLLLTGENPIYKPSFPMPLFNYDNMDRVAEAAPYMIDFLRNVVAHHPPPFFICMESGLPPSVRKMIEEGLPAGQIELVGASDMVDLARQSSHFVVTSQSDAITPGSTVAVEIDLHNPDGRMGTGGTVTWKLPPGFTADQNQWIHPGVEKGSKVSHVVRITAPAKLDAKQVQIEFNDSRITGWNRKIDLTCFQGSTLIIDDFKDASKWKVSGEGQVLVSNGKAEFRPILRNLNEFCMMWSEKSSFKDPSMTTEVEIDFDREPQLELNVADVQGKYTLQMRDDQKKTCKLINYSTAIGKTILDLKAASHWTGKKRVSLILTPRVNSGGSMFVNGIKLYYKK